MLAGVQSPGAVRDAQEENLILIMHQPILYESVVSVMEFVLRNLLNQPGKEGFLLTVHFGYFDE